MKKIKVGLIICLVLMLCGCQNNVHEYKDFIKYLDDMNCENRIQENYISCDIKGKYEIVSDESGTDTYKYDYRIMNIKIKNSPFTFKVSSFRSDGGFPSYKLRNNYSEVVSNYYTEKHPNLFKNDFFETTNGSVFSVNINTSDDLDKLVYYMNEIKENIANDTLQYDFKVPVNYLIHIYFKDNYLKKLEYSSDKFKEKEHIRICVRLSIDKDDYKYKYNYVNSSDYSTIIDNNTSKAYNEYPDSNTKDHIMGLLNTQILILSLKNSQETPKATPDGIQYSELTNFEDYVYATNNVYKYYIIAAGKEKFTNSNIPNDNSFSKEVINYNNAYYDDYLLKDYEEPFHYLLYNSKNQKYYNVKARNNYSENAINHMILNVEEIV